MADNGPQAKGGQGTVVFGTLIPSEAARTWIRGEFLKKFHHGKLAIKKLNWHCEDAEESVKFFKAFVNELSLMAELSHPNIVKLIGFVEDMQKGDAWIVLPWEENGNVREFLQSGEWDIPERISLIQDVLKGVEYLQARQPPICHGDLKSLNILVNSSYHAVITDFGSARSKPDADAEEQNASEIPGWAANDDTAQRLAPPKIEFNQTTFELTLTGPSYTLRWAAPEVLAGEDNGLPSDMWAVGWICWEIVTGKLPFEELSQDQTVIKRVATGKLPAIREQAQLSHVLKLCGLISDCWISNPAGRIDASNFRRRVNVMPSIAPSGSGSGASRIRSAELLLQLGQMYSLQDHKALAESHYKSALDVASRTENQRAGANALVGLGEIYRSQSRNQEAEKALREAHEIQSRIGDDIGAANALFGLGEIYRAQWKNQEAEKALREAHEIHSRIGDDLGAANALHGLGEIYRAQSRNQEAEKALREAHEIHSRIGNDLGAANALDGLGDIYRARSRYQEAENAYSQAHEIHSRIGNDLGAANALHGLGEIYRAQSKNQEAEKALREAHKIHSRIGHDLGAANALLGLGEIYRAQSKNQEAEKALREAHDIHCRIGNDLGAASALDGLGMLFIHQHLLDEAQSSFCQALLAHRRAGPPFSLAQTLLYLGELYRHRGNYLQAEGSLTEALTIGVQLNNNWLQGRALSALARISSSQSKYSATMAAPLQPGAAASERIGDDIRRGMALHNMGKTFLIQSEYGQAEESYSLARAVFLRADDGRGEASALRSLGTLYAVQGRLELAAKRFAQARSTSAGIYDHDGEVMALGGLMGACLQQGNLAGLRAYCVDALRIYGQTQWSITKVYTAS
ncbi:glycoside hydrolase family 5 protein [Tulasnella calospora MUT 4182]|uniref:Glycoside hydrolase family 5 protein n=1 Tax=Tulasnella calospora MUT 4182 TaxID=1051891 RepID=A0A0C3QSS3_9AGAM|nr:glycoside hydrolase family 5 protein [Tulasnella calospora MUT 4182]